jgi:hypothetical protein
MQFYILQYAILGRWVDGGGGRFDQMTVGNILKIPHSQHVHPEQIREIRIRCSIYRYHSKMQDYCTASAQLETELAGAGSK